MASATRGGLILLVAAAVVPVARAEAPPMAPPATQPAAEAGTPLRPAVWSGRGIYYFPGRVRSPLAGVGKRAADASNRLALDDDHSQVTIDGAAHRIVVTNNHRYETKQVIADLLFLVDARTEAGAPVLAGVHVKLEKKKDDVAVEVHPHRSERDKLVRAVIEPFDVVVSNGREAKVVVAAAELAKVPLESKLVYDVAGSVIELKDNRGDKGAPTLAAGTAVADLSIGLGSKRLNKMILRTELVSTDDANRALKGAPLAELLGKGAWELRLTALSSLLPQDRLRRDLFLLGLDRLPVVAEGMKRGLQKNEALVFAFKGGKGTVSWGKASQPLDDALDVGRAFLEFNFLGGVLGRQVALALAAR